jgi:signal transduction histidine kinase
MQNIRPQLLAMSVLLAVTGLCFLLPIPSWVILAVNVLAAEMSAVFIVRCVRRYGPAAYRTWYGFAFVAGFSPLSIVAERYFGALGDVLQPAMDLVTIVVACVCCLSLLKARLLGWPRTVWIDTAILLCGAALLVWSLVLGGTVQEHGTTSAVGSLLVTTIEIAMMGIVMRILLTSGDSTIAALGVVLALASAAIGNAIAVTEPVDGSASYRLMYALWAWVGIVLAIGVSHPGMRGLSESRERQLPRFGRSQILGAGFALGVIPFTAMWGGTSSSHRGDVVWVTVSCLILIFVVARFLALIGEYGRAQTILFRQTQERAALAALGQQAVQVTTIDELLREAADAIRHIVGCSSSGSFEFDGDGNGLRMRAASGVSAELIGSPVFPGVGLAEFESSASNVLTFDDLPTDVSLSESDVRSAVLVLVAGRRRPFGALAMWSSAPNAFRLEDVDFLRSVGVLVATAVDRLLLEVEHRQVQKTESIGRLAAGVAHEINTPVQVASSNLEFLVEAFDGLTDADVALRDLLSVGGAQGALERIDQQHDVAFIKTELPRALAETMEALGKTASIVRAMKAFGSTERSGLSDVNINHVIENTLVVVGHQLENVALVQTDLGDVSPVQANVDDLNQIVLNLVVNAAHAIEDRERSEPGTVTIRTWQENGRLLLSVGDDGVGIDSAIANNIYDPFFTTKEVGRGAGQGLYVVQSIISGLRGTITFDSSAAGTTFVVSLPMSRQQAPTPS